MKSWFQIDSIIEKGERGNYPIFFSKQKPRIINIFFLIDCSGSMMGRRIEEVNHACSEVLCNFDVINPNVSIKVNVLKFGTSVEWMSPYPMPIKEFMWRPIESYGLTSFGEACSELNQKMSLNGFFSSKEIIMKSLLILMTDGEPTDDYADSLQSLLQNPYFINSHRFAIGIGNDYNQSLLAKFAGAKKVFELTDEGDNSYLKPMLERIMQIGLYAASYAALNEENN